MSSRTNRNALDALDATLLAAVIGLASTPPRPREEDLDP